MMEIVQTAGIWAAWCFVWILCLLGVAISCVSFSGTWLVALAAIVATLVSESGEPGWVLVGAYLVISLLVEILEAVSSAWGVGKRGGSREAGLAAFFGSFIGLFLGGFIPIPILGPLIGMFACSFGMTYYVELRRLKHSGQASHIATGALIARVLAIFAKVVASMGMSMLLLLKVLF